MGIKTHLATLTRPQKKTHCSNNSCTPPSPYPLTPPLSLNPLTLPRQLLSYRLPLFLYYPMTSSTPSPPTFPSLPPYPYPHYHPLTLWFFPYPPHSCSPTHTLASIPSLPLTSTPSPPLLPPHPQTPPPSASTPPITPLPTHPSPHLLPHTPIPPPLHPRPPSISRQHPSNTK